MKKGFTLAELIVVITLICVLTLIAVPSVNNTIQKSKKEAYKVSALKIIETAKIYVSGSLNFAQIDVLDNTKLKYETNESPTSGYVQINSDEQARIAVIYDNYCISKSYTEDELTVEEMDSQSTCNLR